jgi:excinuclease ABC subunit C
MTLGAPAAPRRIIANLPSTAGVYRFRDVNGRVLYVGRATDLRHRVASYWSDLGDRKRLAPMVRRIDRIEAVACDSAHEAAWLERNLLETSMPRWNRTAGGQEVPVHVRMEEGPRRPGLSVVHLVEPGAHRRHFGPYLGGTQVRLAVAALERILPLAYTGSGMSGSERDMARQRGVSAADYPWVMDATIAVLERHQDAVARARQALDALRDRAAASLLFELAARIRAERHALDWVTSPQRVTLASGESMDVYGWSNGLLVHYAIREGRLRQWLQTATSLERAIVKVKATPPPWAEFARRNAELAAALAQPGA